MILGSQFWPIPIVFKSRKRYAENCFSDFSCQLLTKDPFLNTVSHLVPWISGFGQLPGITEIDLPVTRFFFFRETGPRYGPMYSNNVGEYMAIHQIWCINFALRNLTVPQHPYVQEIVKNRSCFAGNTSVVLILSIVFGFYIFNPCWDISDALFQLFQTTDGKVTSPMLYWDTVDGPAKSCITLLAWLKHVETI